MRTPSGRTATSSIRVFLHLHTRWVRQGYQTGTYRTNARTRTRSAARVCRTSRRRSRSELSWWGGVDHGELSGTAGPARVSLENREQGQSAYQVHDEDVTAATVDYLNRLGVQKRAGLLDAPFSISVGFMLPHQPFVARQEDYQLYEAQMTMPQNPEPFSEALHPYFRWWREKCGIVEVSDAEVLRARTAYWALVTRMDVMIGQILTALRENGLDENTLILYSSDHGEQVGEHGLWWKQTFYEHSVKVPAILSWRGALPEGRTV